jgi:hypothetical protein
MDTSHHQAFMLYQLIIKKTFASISAWWRLARKDQKKTIENYDALPLDEKLIFINNLTELMIAQDMLFKKLIGNTSHNINIRRVSNDTNFHDVAGVVDEQAAANTMASPAAVHCRSRVRYNTHPPALIEITTVNNQPEEVEVVLNQDDNHDDPSPRHSQGLFASGSDHHDNNNNHNSITPTSLGPKQAKHIAGTEVMNKVFNSMKSISKFFTFTPLSNSYNSDCNDIFLCHVRNVKVTSRVGGDKKVHNLDGNKNIVTILSRSHGHFTRMFKCLVRAVRAKEFGDGRFSSEYECKYIFTLEDEMGLGNFISEIERERESNEEQTV